MVRVPPALAVVRVAERARAGGGGARARRLHVRARARAARAARARCAVRATRRQHQLVSYYNLCEHLQNKSNCYHFDFILILLKAKYL